MENMMPKKAALKDLMKAMRGMDLEKVKGYKKAKDEEPVVTATQVSPAEAKKLKKAFKKDDDDDDED
jgi:hypothetical protein